MSGREADFAKKAPGLDWDQFFQGADLAQANSFIVWQPSAFTALSKLVASAPLDTWKAWLAFHCVNHFAPELPKAFVDARFDFYGKALSGTPQAAGPLEARRQCHQRRAGRCGGQTLRRQIFPARGQGQGAGDGEEHHRRLGPAHRRAHLDDARHQGQGEGKAVRALCRHRLHRKVARLFRICRW